MRLLRQIAPLLSLLLALVVGGEMTDVLPCVDAECGAWSTLLYPDLAPPAGDSGSSGSSAACLCHATFVSTARRLGVSVAAPGEGARLSAAPTPAPAPAGRVPHPPPRA